GSQLTLGYDGANRLVQLTRTTPESQTTRAHYAYDALGRRLHKTVHHPDGSTATTRYGWDGDRLVSEERDTQRTTVIYEPGSFVPMVRIDQRTDSDDTQLSAYVTDALGTPLQLLGPDGTPRWHAQPDDWAAVKDQRGTTTQSIRFQGQWHDDESGLYYNRHRYYDPDIGRYLTQDPIGLHGGLDLYGYVTNPTGMVDPRGLFNTSGLDNMSRAIGPAERAAASGANGTPTAPRNPLQSMCPALSHLGDKEVMLTAAGGKGVAVKGTVKASADGVSTIFGIGAGGGAAMSASVGESANIGRPSGHGRMDVRGFASIVGGYSLAGGEATLSTGTD
ncbi:RHS repeat-associated core domain-containing protein, partial [Halomonas sabkhae]|uniref:RHS repeat-associated core domain-containing protein n=1 Tax=Halomonas sabkhae TaxID=626223 RepID=UPI0025B3F3E3